VQRFSESGDFLGTLGTSQDITERVAAEDALRESEVKFHSAFEHAAIGFAMTTPSGNYLDVNAAYCSLTGYSREELLEHQYFELVHPDDVDENLQFAGRLLAGEISSYTIENRYTRKDGQAIWVRKSISAIYAPYGDPKWLLALVEDINEQKLAEEGLRKSEKIYRAIGESIPYGIWVCDPHGRNIYASQSYLDLVGITQEQCSAFGWGNTLHPEDAERTIAAWKECVRTEGLWDIEHRFLGKDGQYHPILARGVPVRDEQGRIVCWAGINLDIGRFKKVEQDL
jgi:PAS domain S-box-containing protein